MRTTVPVLALLLCILMAAPRAQAQGSHAASQAAIDRALQEHVSTTQADREVVLQVLRRAEVQGLAADLGLDLRRAQAATSTLEGQELGDLAAQARRVDNALAGGQSKITVSTTLIIVALLVLILLIVALK
jgi:hypothetical protein